MERLTFEGNFCDIAQCRELPCKYDGNCSQKQVWGRLKQFEDTTRTPEEVAALSSLFNFIVEESKSVEEEIALLSRLRELYKADKDGRLVVRPCKVTDKLYAVGKRQIVECAIAETHLNDDGTIEYLVNFECAEDCTGCPFDSWARESVSDEYYCGGEYGDGSVSSKDFGKTVFLTREEAEKALQEMEDKKDG